MENSKINFCFLLLIKNSITVNNVKSTANDCGSCSVAGSSDKKDTTDIRPCFSSDILRSKSRIRFKLRLCDKYLVSLRINYCKWNHSFIWR